MVSHTSIPFFTRSLRIATYDAVVTCLTLLMWTAQAVASPPHTAHEDGTSALLDRWMTCETADLDENALDDLFLQLRRQFSQDDDEIDAAIVRARRSARLPEVVRIQTSARVDRDQQNRKRLTEDFDERGDIRRSVLEDRDTYQDDAYLQVAVSAEWRLTRTRWSTNEVALRRERTALKKDQRAQEEALSKHWFALLRARMKWCDYEHDYVHDRAHLTESDARIYSRTRLEVWEALRMIDILTDGWFIDTLRTAEKETSHGATHHATNASVGRSTPRNIGAPAPEQAR